MIRAGLLIMLIVGFSRGAHAASPKTRVVPDAIALSIEEYVRTVLRQGDRALTALNDFENANFDYRVAYRQSRGPRLSVDSSVSKSRTDEDSVIDRSESAQGSATLDQPVFFTGGSLVARVSESTNRIESAGLISRSFTRPTYFAAYRQPLFLFVGNSEWRSWRRARVNYAISSDFYRRELQSIENAARARYYDVLLQSEQLQVEQSKLQASRRAHRVTAALVDAGRLAGIELARSEIRLQKDIRRLKNAETALQQAINDAIEFASLKTDATVQFTSQLGYTPLTLPVEKLVEFALLHRPDYLAAKRQLELADLSIRESLEANNPRMFAEASVEDAESGSATARTETNVWTGTLRLSWDLFDSRVTYLRSEAARNQLENARVAFRGLERNIRTEVANAFLEVKRTETQLEDLRTSREQARQSVDAVRIRYQSGRDRLIDVFDSEQELRDLELEYLNVVISANLAKDRLALLIGGDLENVK